MSRVLDRLEVPVIGAPLSGGPSTPELAAAVSGAGGLGFLAAGYLSAAQLGDRLAAARGLTTRPFGVNLFCPGRGPAAAASYAAYAARVNDWARRNGLPPGTARYSDDDWVAKLALLAAQTPAVVSVTFGCPSAAEVDALDRAGAEVWVTVTSSAEAEAAVAAGAAALVVQGGEAGGHRGSFTDIPGAPVHRVRELLALVARAVPSVPLIAAGGIADAAATTSALAGGASAVQAGTAFLLATEAGTTPAHRDALRAAVRPTMLTRAFTGRLARGLRNGFIDEHEPAAVLAYPEIHYLTAPLRAAARAAGDPEAFNLWAGERYADARALPAGEITRRLAP